MSLAAKGQIVQGLAPKIVADVLAAIRPKMVSRNGFTYVYTMTTHCGATGDASPWTIPTPGAGAAAQIDFPMAVGTTPGADGYFPVLAQPGSYNDQAMQALHTQFAEALETVDLTQYVSPYLNDSSLFAFLDGSQTEAEENLPIDGPWTTTYPLVARHEVKIRTAIS